MALSDLKNRFNTVCSRIAIMPFISKRHESGLETLGNASALYYGRAVQIVLSRHGVANPNLYNSRYYKQGRLEMFDQVDLDGKKIYTLRYDNADMLNVTFPRSSFGQPAGPVYASQLGKDKAWRRELMALYDETISPRSATQPGLSRA